MSKRGADGVSIETDARRSTVIKDLMRGDETSPVRHLLDMRCPISNGVIQNIDDMIELWNYAFYEKLGLSSGHLKERRLLLSEVPLFSMQHRTALYEVMFETYGFAGLQSAVQGVLTLFSSGLETGVAVECGEGISHCTPIFEGYALPNANRQLLLGGKDITDYLSRLLQRRGYSFHQSHDVETVRRIKERFCYAAVDRALETQLAVSTTTLEQQFLLPDGSVCSIGAERFEATEVLFQPHLIDVESEGLSAQLWSCIQAADIDLRASLYGSIVLSGGSTMFPGLSTRLAHDMSELFLTHNAKGDRSRLRKFPLRIEDPPRRKHMVFLGGATLATLTAGTPQMWMSRAEWEEGGESAVRARFGGY